MSRRAKAPAAEMAGGVDRVAFLAPDVLLVTGSVAAAAGPDAVTLVTPDRTTPPHHEIIVLERRGVPDEQTWLLLARIVPDELKGTSSTSIVVGAPSRTVAIAPPDPEVPGGDIQALVRDLVGTIDDAHGPEVVEWLCRTTGQMGSATPERVSASLFDVREVLRERLPRCELLPGARQAISVDLVLQADPTTFYLKGWCRNVGSPLARMTAVSPEGHRAELLSRVFRHPRGDVAEFYAGHAGFGEDTDYGFIATVELGGASMLDAGWLVEIVDADGVGVEALGGEVQRDAAAVRQLVLFDLVYERPGEDALRAGHLAPALVPLQERWHRTLAGMAVNDYGTVPVDPAVTIIVPLYQKLEFLEHQLAQFVHDDEISANELLYVLDSPDDEAWLRHLATTLFPLYRVPFRTVVMSKNGGFAAANNVGAAMARGKKLLLLNSDVLPDLPGWLGRMVRFYDETPDVGALGVKLLYEDDSLQHAGLYFEQVQDGGAWNNEHLFKGLHRSFPGANIARRVPAVTAACLMIDRQLFHDVGGMSTAYVQGDYEDSDLCLRLAAKGKCAWYLPSVELYHLEAQSYPSTLRAQTTQYNRWLHTHLWDEEIEAVAAAWKASE